MIFLSLRKTTFICLLIGMTGCTRCDGTNPPNPQTTLDQPAVTTPTDGTAVTPTTGDSTTTTLPADTMTPAVGTTATPVATPTIQ